MVELTERETRRLGVKQSVLSLQCEYIDWHGYPKGEIEAGRRRVQYSCRDQIVRGLDLRTCLRFESYRFQTIEHPVLPLTTSGTTAYMRLVALAAGLESELVGEMQIREQILRSIAYASSRSWLSADEQWLLEEAVRLSDELRRAYNISSFDSYASIGARILEDSLKGVQRPTIMIIGAGRMVEVFLKTLQLQGRYRAVMVNRHPELAHELALRVLGEPPLMAVRPSEAAILLPLVDGVFAAVKGGKTVLSPFDAERVPEGTTLVDISYPSVLARSAGAQTHDLESFDWQANQLSKPHPVVQDEARSALSALVNDWLER